MEPKLDLKKVDAEAICLFAQVQSLVAQIQREEKPTYPGHGLKVVNAYIEQKVAEQKDPKQKTAVKAELETQRVALYVAYMRVYAQLTKDGKVSGADCKRPAPIIVRQKPTAKVPDKSATTPKQAEMTEEVPGFKKHLGKELPNINPNYKPLEFIKLPPSCFYEGMKFNNAPNYLHFSLSIQAPNKLKSNNPETLKRIREAANKQHPNDPDRAKKLEELLKKTLLPETVD